MKNFNQILITRTYAGKDLKIGFVQTEVANDYYYIYKGQKPEGPYADEGEAYGGWYRANG